MSNASTIIHKMLINTRFINERIFMTRSISMKILENRSDFYAIREKIVSITIRKVIG